MPMNCLLDRVGIAHCFLYLSYSTNRRPLSSEFKSRILALCLNQARAIQFPANNNFSIPQVYCLRDPDTAALILPVDWTLSDRDNSTTLF